MNRNLENEFVKLFPCLMHCDDCRMMIQSSLLFSRNSMFLSCGPQIRFMLPALLPCCAIFKTVCLSSYKSKFSLQKNLRTVLTAKLTVLVISYELTALHYGFVKIFTDSQATLFALHNTIVTSQLVKNTILALNALS